MMAYSSVLCSVLLFVTLARYSSSLPESCDVVIPVRISPSPGSNSPTLEEYLELLASGRLPVINNITTCYNLTLLSGRHSFSAPKTAVTLPDTVISAESSPVIVEFSSAFASNSVLDIQNIGYLEVRGITFLSSSGFLSFFNADTILISSCVFSNFTQGALNVRNTRQLTISDTTFARNGGLEASRLNGQQGGSGGLSVSYEDSLTQFTNATLTITNCLFVRNDAESQEDVSLTPSEFSTGGLDFTGRGGALSLLFNSNTPVTAEIKNCQFINNIAEGYGGAVYLLFKSKSSHRVDFISSQFRDNEADLIGGAIGIAHVRSSSEIDSRVNMVDCVFDSNEASYGGAVYFVATTNQSAEGSVGVIATFSNCSFFNNIAINFGAAIGITALNLFAAKFQNNPVEVKNCMFVHNSGRGGALSVSYYPLVISGNNTFTDNTGPALLVLGAKLRVMGDTLFEGNNAVGKDGGALYVLSYGQMVFAQQGLKLIFNNNIGDLGASLVLEVPKTPRTYSTILYNPLCPITHDQNRTSPMTWQRVNMGFNGNIAQVGAAIYTNRLALCSWTNNNAPYFNISRAFRWNFIKFGSNNNRLKNNQIDDQVQTQAVSIRVRGQINAYPGEKSEINVVTLGELGQPTYTVWRLRQNSNTVRFDPQVYSSSNLTMTSSSVPLTVYSNRSLNEDDTFREDQPVVNATVETLLTTDPSSTSIAISLRDCPPGYLLQPWSNLQSYDDCTCNQLNRQEIMQCDGREITLNGAFWARRERSVSDQLFITTCPPGYCRCTVSRETGVDSCHYVYNTRSTDSICSCQREGAMCGVCKNTSNSSFGVSALLNKCVTCDNGFASLIVLLIFANAAVITVLLLIMVPFPDWLLPFVFYIQMLPFITEYFPVTFDKLSPYLYYISSASSFYFAYDFCLYSNMSALVSFTLRFIPLLTAVIVCPIILLVRLMFIKRAMVNPQSRHPLSRPVPWHGAWWIMVLCTTHSVHSALSVLRCPSLPNGRSRGSQLRWFYDASVQCFTGGHMALVLLALAVLIVAVTMIPVSIILAKDFIKRVRFTHYLGMAFTSCYNEQVWWWCGVEQARRIVFLIFIVALPQNTFPALFLLMISVCVYGVVMPYKSRIANIMELLLASCIIIMLLIPNTTRLVELLSDIPKQPPPPSTCQDDIEGFTPLALLLGVFYYIPLALAIGLCIVMLSIWIYLRVINHLQKSRTENITYPRKRFSFVKRSRGFTKSEVAINDCQSSSLTGEAVRLAQQRSKLPSLRKRSNGGDYEMVDLNDSTKIKDEEKSDVFSNSTEKITESPEDSSSSGSEPMVTIV